MPRKKKTEPMDEPNEEMNDKDFVKYLLEAMRSIPNEMYLSLILSVAWSKTHEGGLNTGDMLLGGIGGFTLPSALKGDLVANSWAIAYLGALGLNFIDQDIGDWWEKNKKFVSPVWSFPFQGTPPNRPPGGHGIFPED